MDKILPVAMLALLPAAWAQPVVSARSGLIEYFEGRVLLDGKQVAPKTGEFLQIDNGQVLATADGRAEVLLAPGAFLRMAENSSVRMVSNGLSDARVEILSGSSIVEVDGLLKDNAITLLVGGKAISLAARQKGHGLYRIDAEAGRLRVYDGEAKIASAGRRITLSKGREVKLNGRLSAAKFDLSLTDPFDRWSERRSTYIAIANLAAARSLIISRLGSQCGSRPTGWGFNPWFGMYTFMPCDGFFDGPVGYEISSREIVYWYVARHTNGRTAILENPAGQGRSPLTARTVPANRDRSNGPGIAEGPIPNNGFNNVSASPAPAPAPAPSPVIVENRSAPAPAPAPGPVEVSGARGR